MPKAVAIVSGGLDSVTLAYLLQAEGYELHLLSFDYGQRHRKELAYAERCAKRLEVAFDIVDLSSLGRFLNLVRILMIAPLPVSQGLGADRYGSCPGRSLRGAHDGDHCRAESQCLDAFRGLRGSGGSESSGGGYRCPCGRSFYLPGLSP